MQNRGKKSKKTDIITTKHGSRGYKMCQCCVCETVSKCTPTNDFYSTAEHGDGILCEKCFHVYVSKQIGKYK
jgi:hypothetical protein